MVAGGDDATLKIVRRKYAMKSLRIIACFLILALFAGCAADHVLTRSSADRETVVLIHGLGRSAVSMWMLESRIEKAGYEVVALGYPSLGTKPVEVIQVVTRQIDACCRDKAKVHFVSHSMMRYDHEVADQTIAFLKNGRFRH